MPFVGLQVSAGLGHTVACFTNGSAYAWGLNNDGQLGLGHDSTCTSPQLVDAAVLEELDVVKVTGCPSTRHIRTQATLQNGPVE